MPATLDEIEEPHAGRGSAPSCDRLGGNLGNSCCCCVDAPPIEHEAPRRAMESRDSGMDCAKCGRTSDHINKEDALVELKQYECELPTQGLGMIQPSAELTFDSAIQRIKISRLYEIIIYLIV